MADIDINQIGRQGYKMLQSMHIIGDKDKKDLTLKEREELIKNLYEHLNMSIVKCGQDRNQKYEFLSFLCITVILYLDNLDLNKFIKISVKD